jgi:hypothetical protein
MDFVHIRETEWIKQEKSFPDRTLIENGKPQILAPVE